MLVISQARLVFLAVPKTGTTSIESALRGHSDLVFARGLKHMPARRFNRKVRPFLAGELGLGLETVALMREPLDQIGSWFRYRARPSNAEGPKSTAGLSFDEFVMSLMLPDPPPFADIGSQYRFLTGPGGSLAVDHLFAYEAQDAFAEFLSARLGFEVDFDQRNVSPHMNLSLSDAVDAALRQSRPGEFALYERLMASGGHLTPKRRRPHRRRRAAAARMPAAEPALQGAAPRQ